MTSSLGLQIEKEYLLEALENEKQQVIDDYARRTVDLAARFGGEEFAIILSDTDSEKILIKSQNKCAWQSSTLLYHMACPLLQIS
jgi:GGDEF domain-containing protein